MKTRFQSTTVSSKTLYIEIEEQLESFVLGGEGVRVQIDESHEFTRKHNVGRVLVTTTYGWVFGIIEDKEHGKLFLQMVEFRDSETLEEIIKKRIRKETTIFSDSWPSYQNFGSLGINITKSITRSTSLKCKMKSKRHHRSNRM